MVNPTRNLTKLVAALASECYYENGDLRRDTLGTTLGSGLFRTVIERLGFALKFAHNSSDVEYNQSEWKLYYSTSDDVRNVMAKPVAISGCGRVLAMELVDTTVSKSTSGADVDFDEYLAAEKRVDKFNARLVNMLEETGMTRFDACVLCSDNHTNNIGIKNGRLLWIDYAGV